MFMHLPHVIWSKKVAKQLDRIPQHLRNKFVAWVMVVERVGLAEARQLTGYHDEPLKGQRKDQRSIRLNRAYRAVYMEIKGAQPNIVEVLEVSKHEY